MKKRSPTVSGITAPAARPTLFALTLVATALALPVGLILTVVPLLI